MNNNPTLGQQLTKKSTQLNIHEGDVVKNKASGRTYLVTGCYGNRATAVRTVDITNPSEWELITLHGRVDVKFIE